MFAVKLNKIKASHLLDECISINSNCDGGYIFYDYDYDCYYDYDYDYDWNDRWYDSLFYEYDDLGRCVPALDVDEKRNKKIESILNPKEDDTSNTIEKYWPNYEIKYKSI